MVMGQWHESWILLHEVQFFSLIDSVTEEKFIYCNQYDFTLCLNQKLLFSGQ